MNIAHLIPRLEAAMPEQFLQGLLKYRSAEFQAQAVFAPLDGPMRPALEKTGVPVIIEPDAKPLIDRLQAFDLLNVHVIMPQEVPEVSRLIGAVGRPYLFTCYSPMPHASNGARLTLFLRREAYEAFHDREAGLYVEMGVDRESLRPVTHPTECGRLRMVYGTPPGFGDEGFWPVMADIMARHPHVELVAPGFESVEEGRLQTVVNREELRRRLGEADLFVHLPLPDELSPSPLLMEAMALGIPGILSTAEGNYVAGRAGKTALMVRHGDTEALEAAIETLVLDRRLREQMGEEARPASARFDVRERAVRFEGAYRCCLESAVSSRPSPQRRQGVIRRLIRSAGRA